MGLSRQATACFLTSALCALLATGALAQGAGGGTTDAAAGSKGAVRSAGDEARFRVIQRFPEASPIALLATTPSAQFAPIVEAVQAQDWAGAHQLLARATVAGEVAQSASMTFLAAYVAQRAGHHAHALTLFQTLPGRIVELDDYVHFYAAQSAHQDKKYHESVLHAASVGPDSLHYATSLIALSASLIAAATPSDIDRAIEILALYLKLYPTRRDAAEVRMTLGALLEGRQDFAAAGGHYLDVWNLYPLSSSATRAREKLTALKSKLPEALKLRVDAPSSTERELRRYNALFDLHRSESLIPELLAALESWKVGSPERCEALLLVARSHTKLRQHSDGTPVYERIIKECKGSDFELRALYLGGRGMWNINQRAPARVFFERIWTEFPNHSFADDSMYFSARMLREDNKNEEARKLLRAQVKRYPKDDMAKDAHWLLVREMFETKGYKGVVEYVDALTETGEDDLYTRGRLHYFRARALEFLADKPAAQKSFADVISRYPKTYYALLAFNRLAELSGKAEAGLTDVCKLDLGVCKPVNLAASEPRPIEIPLALRDDLSFKRGLLLLSLGLSELAGAEFGELRSRHAREPATLWALAYLLDSARVYTISHDIARRSIDNWVVGYPDDATRAHWHVAFPTPFKPLVSEWAAARKIPMELVYAIMREESGFNPRIESWANARGLLQLMEPTAQSVARSDNFGTLATSQLFDPTINIRLGTGYMAELAGQLKGHPALIIAGYNGGYGNVSRWLGERGELPLDLWVEDIPFGQTRDYTKRVLASFWTYAYLYGENRVPKVAFELK
ncbi:MAG: transglycosylase SLT domain-containing protein [Bradymonadaceae bacterium]|nr:transglycosylase SLT domain-containing protein [Lujinxingiaceae bacterium]